MNNFLCTSLNKLLRLVIPLSCLGLFVCFFLCFPLFVLGIDFDVEALLAGR